MTATMAQLPLSKPELDALVALRRDLHAHPEVGMHERRTSGVIVDALRSMGIEHKSGLAGGTGVIAHIPGGNGATIALRADIDALPITEGSGLPHASTVPGVMHACGHDGHTAILLGAARVLQRLSQAGDLPGPVTLLFQPAEENLGGAVKMIESGCLDGVLGDPPRAIFGLHGWPWMQTNHVGVRNGALLASTDYFKVTIQGRGAHAAWPHLAHDPLVASCAVVTALQTVVSRSTDPLDSVVVSVCQLHSGDTFNVIPEVASLTGTVRTLSAQSRAATLARIHEVVQFAASTHGCKGEISFDEGCPATINHSGATDLVRDAVRSMARATLVEVAQPCMGGEDFACYAQKIPASFFLLGLQDPAAKPMPPLHHPTFDFNDDAIATGIGVFCAIAMGRRSVAAALETH